jgi:16S rRNA processing protein RimM
LKTVEIGRVLRPHGLRGELKVRLHWDGSTTLSDVESVVIGEADQTRTLAVESVRPGPKGALLKLAGIDDCDAAQALAGAPVSVPRSALPALEAGEYYLSDLIGAEVWSPEGRVGEVIEVRLHPSIDSLVVRRSDGSVLEQALTEPWLESVDVEAGRVTLTSTEGLV